jgi:hypothetical protein
MTSVCGDGEASAILDSGDRYAREKAVHPESARISCAFNYAQMVARQPPPLCSRYASRLAFWKRARARHPLLASPPDP